MRWFLRASPLAAAVALLATTPATALMVAMKSPTQRAATADVIVVGKVTAIEKETEDATQFPGQPNKVPHKVAVVKVETGLLGAANLTHVKVGFVPAPPVNRDNPAPPGIRPPIRRQPPPELKEGQEVLLFLVKHPDGASFYVMPPMSPPVEVKDEAGKKEVEAVKKVAGVLADPAKAMKADKADDRYFAASVLVTKYRSYPEFNRGEVDQTPIGAEESKALLKALAEGDWAAEINEPGRVAAPNGMQALYTLGLTDKDGWAFPKIPPNENPSKLMQAAFVQWLDGPGKDYQVKKITAKK